MPESPEEMYDRLAHAAGPDGRLALPDMSTWRHFPWEAAEGQLVAKVLNPPVEVDNPRTELEGCPVCGRQDGDRTIWRNDRFFVSTLAEPSGLPIVLFLQTIEHLDFPEMDDDLARECGQLQVILCRIIESLPHIGRAHVMRIGDGSEHMHLWFVARPERFDQIVGTLAIEWDEILPPGPDDVRQADLAEVARHLATHDGVATI